MAKSKTGSISRRVKLHAAKRRRHAERAPIDRRDTSSVPAAG